MSIDNLVTISGNLAQDAEFRQHNQETKVTKLTIAVNESYKNRETGEWDSKADFFKVEVWNKRAESSRDYKKGEFVTVQGKLKTKKWETQEGEKRKEVVIVADEVQNLSRRLSGSQKHQNQTQDVVETAIA